MPSSIETLIAACDAQTVAGSIIAVIDGEHVQLGAYNLGEVVLNERGRAIFDKATAPAPAEDPAPRQRRTRTAASSDAPADAPADPAPAETTIDLTDAVQAEESVG